MKTTLKSVDRLRRHLRGLFGIAALANTLVLSCGAAAFDSPVGTWDFTGSGAGQSTLTILTFSNDFSFKGYELLVTRIKPNRSTFDGRDDSSNNSRGDTGSGGGSSSGTVLFGFGPIAGPWHFDLRGRVVGFFTEVVSQAAEACTTTNLSFTVTNFDGSISYEQKTNFTVCFTGDVLFTNISWSVNSTNDGTLNVFSTNLVFVGNTPGVFTNAVSFTAQVTPNKRLTMVGTSAVGKMNYSGIPAAVMQDVSGSWFGVKTVDKLPSNEFFDLTSSQVSNLLPTDFPDLADFPNIYCTTNGVGPGYTIDKGVAMVSLHKQIGFAFLESSGTLRATIGNFISNKRIPAGGKTKGIIDPGISVKFDAALQPVLP